MRQDLDRLHDLANSRGHILHVEPGHVVEKSIEIVQDFRREFDAGHPSDQRRGVRASGLCGRSPLERASSQAFASSQGMVFPVSDIFAPAFVRDAMEGLVQFNLLHRLGDGIENECVSGLPGSLSPPRQRVLSAGRQCGWWSLSSETALVEDLVSSTIVLRRQP